MVICAGVDLAARAHRPTGIAIVEAGSPRFIHLISVTTAYEDVEIVELLKKSSTVLAAVDSPLSLPASGRKYREVDLEMIRQGYRVLPPSWRYMRELTMRAMKLIDTLKLSGIEVVETHPLSALKSSRCLTPSRLFEKVFTKPIDTLGMSKHEVDAVIASIVCVYHHYGESHLVRALDGLIALLPPLC